MVYTNRKSDLYVALGKELIAHRKVVRPAIKAPTISRKLGYRAWLQLYWKPTGSCALSATILHPKHADRFGFKKCLGARLPSDKQRIFL
eukprot:705912-Pelagomonas_calceolata.AAC.1